MASIITDIETVRLYATVDANMILDTIKPHIDLVEKDIIIPALTATLHTNISAVDNTLSDKQKELKMYAQRALVNLALYSGAQADLQVNVGDGGIRQSHSDQLKPAFERNIRDYKADKFLKGYQALDAMYVFLEENENEEDFNDWKDSPAYTKFAELFIRTAAVLAKYYTLVQSRYLFLQLKPHIEAAEQGIVQDIVHHTLFKTLKETWLDGSISTENKKLIPYIQKLVADTAIYKGLEFLSVNVDERGITIYQSASVDTTEQRSPADLMRVDRLKNYAKGEAMLSAKRLTQFLQANKTYYPEYTGDPLYNEASPQTLGGIASENGKVVFGI